MLNKETDKHFFKVDKKSAKMLQKNSLKKYISITIRRFPKFFYTLPGHLHSSTIFLYEKYENIFSTFKFFEPENCLF